MNTYKRYVSIREQIESLEAKLVPVKEEIVASMLDQEVPEVETDEGIFRLRQVRTFRYPASVEKMVAELAEAKRKAESTGKAKVKEEYTTLVYLA